MNGAGLTPSRGEGTAARDGGGWPARLLAELRPALDECVHCGLCLPTCPTYAETGSEMDSPRGRIYTIRALGERRIAPTASTLAHLDGCLDCRACETACPSGVRYGSIIEGARAALEAPRRRGPFARLVRTAGLRWVLPRRAVLGAAMTGLAVWQRSGLDALLRFAPRRMREAALLAPRAPWRGFLSSAPEVFPAAPPRRGRVALFVGCVMDRAMPATHRATVAVLTANGFEVVVPRRQLCCGALHVHNGDRDFARRLAATNACVFAALDVERVIVNAAGCGAQLQEVVHLMPDDPAAHALAEKAQDVTAFLAARELRPLTHAVPRRAAFDEPCHLLHAQRVSAAPRELLSRIPGLTLVPLAESDMCCGSAGIYNLTQAQMARRLLDRKIAHVAASGADLLVTANPGCQLQLAAGLRAHGLPIDVRHVIEVLAEGYGWHAGP